jgi:hypothetical protein
MTISKHYFFNKGRNIQIYRLRKTSVAINIYNITLTTVSYLPADAAAFFTLPYCSSNSFVFS